MLDFSLTEEQRNIRDLAHDFAEQEIRPVAWEYDRDATWPHEVIDKAWEVGLMNSQFPERYGGTGASGGSSYVCLQDVRCAVSCPDLVGRLLARW
jgi:acyl-CoA dehydrogenase